MPSKRRVQSLLPANPRKRRKVAHSPRQRPRQARARATFDSIVEAAALIIEDLGYQALSTNGIAAVAGVAVGALYSYFPNKESIVAELARQTIDKILAEVEIAFGEAMARGRKDDAIEKLVRTCLAVLRRRSKLLKVFSQEAGFVWHLDEIKTFPTKLFEIAWKARALVKPGIVETNREAMAYLYLLIPIGRWVSYAAIVDRPPWLTENAAEEAAVEIFQRLLA